MSAFSACLLQLLQGWSCDHQVPSSSDVALHTWHRRTWHTANSLASPGTTLTGGLHLACGPLHVGVHALEAVDEEGCLELVHTPLREGGILATLGKGRACWYQPSEPGPAHTACLQ